MAKSRQQKEKAVSEIAAILKKMKAAVFANFDGLKVKEIDELRKLCRQEKIDYVVAKKTLLGRAFKEVDLKNVDPKTIDGGIATVVGYEDEVAPAKLLATFAKNHQALKINGGILENKFVDAAVVNSLAKLPSKLELLAKMVGSIKAPLSGLANVLQGVPRNLVYALKAIQDKKQ
ncbi:MAG: 50S ribosomal protein L10 [Patescibacteria group bacterium]